MQYLKEQMKAQGQAENEYFSDGPRFFYWHAIVSLTLSNKKYAHHLVIFKKFPNAYQFTVEGCHVSKMLTKN